MTTRKTIALIIWTFVGKVMSLLFNMLSRLVAGVQPQWIQGIQSGDGVGELDTIALIKY